MKIRIGIGAGGATSMAEALPEDQKPTEFSGAAAETGARNVS